MVGQTASAGGPTYPKAQMVYAAVLAPEVFQNRSRDQAHVALLDHPVVKHTVDRFQPIDVAKVHSWIHLPARLYQIIACEPFRRYSPNTPISFQDTLGAQRSFAAASPGSSGRLETSARILPNLGKLARVNSLDLAVSPDRLRIVSFGVAVRRGLDPEQLPGPL